MREALWYAATSSDSAVTDKGMNPCHANPYTSAVRTFRPRLQTCPRNALFTVPMGQCLNAGD